MLGLILLSSIIRCIIVQCNRSAYRDLQYSRQVYHELQIEHDQLLLEYGTLSNCQRIEKIATETLDMLFANTQQITFIKP